MFLLVVLHSDGVQDFIYPETSSKREIDGFLESCCTPDFNVLCGSQYSDLPYNDSSRDGLLWLHWSSQEELRHFDDKEEVASISTCSLGYSEMSFPKLMSYSANSPDIPEWLKSVNNAVLAEQYITPLLGGFQSYALDHEYTWSWYANKKLVEKKCSIRFAGVVTSKHDNCSTRTFYQNDDSMYQIHETNNTAGFNLHYQELIYYFDSVDPIDDQHQWLLNNSSTRTLHLRCCNDNDAMVFGDFGNNTHQNRFVHFDDIGSSFYVCSSPMCNASPKTINESSNILSSAWKSTLKNIIYSSAARLDIYLQRFPKSPATLEFSYGFESSVYSTTELLSLFGGGTGNRTVQNLVDFFAIRDNSTSDTFFDVETYTGNMKTQITTLPNHLWDINTFMGIIEQATLEFHEDLIVTSIYNNLAKKLQQPIVDAVLESIVLRRQNGWNVPDINSSLSKIDTPVFEGHDIKSCIMRQATDLLEGSKCWQAMELYPKAIASLDTTMINQGRAVYVHFVGALLIASLMLQSWIRYHRLPGGLYYTYDKERLKRRREQVRMALNDEYLCRVQEHHATQQFGKERAREVLDTLKNAANREADLPSNYQYRQRKLSRRVIVVGHIFLMLIGPLNDLDAYMNLLCVVLLVNLLQSLLESKACKLVEQQSLTKREMEATHLCPTLEVNCPNLEHKETPLPSVQSSLFSNV